jgi:2-hydroxychromene-2-carboxylate isomerase
MKSIQFFFELASPYSYIASLQIESLAANANRAVYWRPIEIEVVWSAQGVLEAYAAVRRAKRHYIAVDSRRCASANGITLAKPVTSARNTSLAKLAFWGINASDPGLAKRFIQAVWHRHFSEGKPIETTEDLAAASGGLQLDSAAIGVAAGLSQARASQDQSNADAVNLGCFGVPWFVADGEAFFGQDRLAALASQLHANPAA